eukprot:Nk52_evm45s2039 gene=Nk52_evmTU45s2039
MSSGSSAQANSVSPEKILTAALLGRVRQLKTALDLYEINPLSMSWNEVLEKFTVILGLCLQISEQIKNSSGLNEVSVFPGLVSNEKDGDLELLTNGKLQHVDPEIITSVLLRTKLIPEIEGLKDDLSDPVDEEFMYKFNQSCFIAMEIAEKLKEDYDYQVSVAQPERSNPQASLDIANRYAAAKWQGAQIRPEKVTGEEYRISGLVPSLERFSKKTNIHASSSNVNSPMSEGGFNVTGSGLRRQDVLVKEVQTEISEQDFANIQLNSVEQLRNLVAEASQDVEKKLIQELDMLQNAEQRSRSNKKNPAVSFPPTEEQHLLDHLQSERRRFLLEHYDKEREDIMKAINGQYNKRFKVEGPKS